MNTKKIWNNLNGKAKLKILMKCMSNKKNSARKRLKLIKQTRLSDFKNYTILRLQVSTKIFPRSYVMSSADCLQLRSTRKLMRKWLTCYPETKQREQEPLDLKKVVQLTVRSMIGQPYLQFIKENKSQRQNIPSTSINKPF